MSRRFEIVLSIQVGQQQGIYRKPSDSNKQYNTKESTEEFSA